MFSKKQTLLSHFVKVSEFTKNLNEVKCFAQVQVSGADQGFGRGPKFFFKY